MDNSYYFEVQLIFDVERDHYQWMNVEWEGFACSKSLVPRLCLGTQYLRLCLKYCVQVEPE
jgi:hypothetical protein